MEPSILNSVRALVRQKEPSVVNKLMEKLAGPDNVRAEVERIFAEAMSRS